MDETTPDNTDGDNTTASSKKFNVNLLDFMNADEFVQIMRNKTEGNYNALWDASKSLAQQLKTSKSLLTVNSYMCMGKTKNEILEKLVDSLKFALNADHVYILEYVAHSNVLIVTHSDNIKSINQRIPVSDGGIEGKLQLHCYLLVIIFVHRRGVILQWEIFKCNFRFFQL